MSANNVTKAPLVIVALAVLVFLAQGEAFIQANSQTYDEAMHLAAGYSILHTGDFRLGAETPPLVKLLAALAVQVRYRLPFSPGPLAWARSDEWQIGVDFLYGTPSPPDEVLATARRANLSLGAVLVALIGWWSYRRWGAWAGAAAATLAALEPNLVAHASLVSTDVGVALFSFGTMYLLWEYVRHPSHGLLTATGTCLGLALATKFSALLLVIIVGVAFVLYLLGGGSIPFLGRAGSGERLRDRAFEATAPALRIFFWAAATLVCAYLVYGFPAWGRGLRIHWEHQKVGHASFFLGTYSSTGWWAYFPVAFLIKTPVGTLILVGTSLVLWRWGERLGRTEAIFLLMPAVLFLVAGCASRVQIGLRHILPVYPFLLVLAGRLVTVRRVAGWSGRWLAPFVVGVPLALAGTSALRMAPHQLAYFNELVGGPAAGFRYLSDSNLDWGQDLKGLRIWLEKEDVPRLHLSYFGTAPPDAYGIQYQWLPGVGQFRSPPPAPAAKGGRELLAVSVVNLQGIYLPDRDLYRWLWQRTPLARIGDSIYVYDITDDADAQHRLTAIRERAQAPQSPVSPAR